MKSLENKIPPPLVAFALALAMLAVSRFDSVLVLDQTARFSLATVFWLTGVVFSLGGVAAFKKSRTTVNPLKPETASSLVTSGIYQITRNPMYVGFALFLVAWAIYLSSILSLLLVAAFVAFIQRFQIVPEERAMLLLFGQEFHDYRSKVRRWL